MKFQNFALTVKKNVAKDVPLSASEYKPVWDLFEGFKIDICHLCDELDGRSKIHYHGICKIPKSFFRQKLRLEGFHILVLPLPTQADTLRWLKYCYKEQDPKYWPEDIPDVDQSEGDFNRCLFKNCCNGNDLSITV